MLHLDLSMYTMTDTIPLQDNFYHRLMKDEDFLTFFLYHSKKHDKNGGTGIRTIFDFYLLFKRKKYDEASLLERLEREDLLDFYMMLKSIVNFWFYDNEITKEILDFEIYTVTGGTYGNLENIMVRKIEKKCGAFIFFTRIFPSFKLMSTRYPVLKKCPILLPVFYLVRIFCAMFDGSIKKNMKAITGATKKKREVEKLALKESEKHK